MAIENIPAAAPANGHSNGHANGSTGQVQHRDIDASNVIENLAETLKPVPAPETLLFGQASPHI
ncbi:hypothetical protein HGRIS_007331 [Hohenbuehelia grisea]|uniref:Uncharacterized protein n=1 Tax=Hohenbuehelia grisea TaxID=104357 RepID=A0ABR3J4F6_9AGAR